MQNMSGRARFYSRMVLVLVGLVVMVLFSQRCRAQLSDNFTNDGSLNTDLWTTSSSLLSSLAGEFGSTLIAPTLSFGAAGMTISGVNGDNEIAGVQSLASFQPPFTLTLAWSAVAGATYQAQYTDTLTRAQWNNLGSPVTATNSLVKITDTPNTQRFYRVALMP
jgi:hypothetical protein